MQTTAESKTRKPKKAAPAEPVVQPANEQPGTAIVVSECPVSLPAVNDLKTKYSPLSIAGIDDKTGFDAVDEARKHVKRWKVDLEHWREDQVAAALAHQRKVNGFAKPLREELEALEKSLADKQKVITDEQAAIEKQKADELFASRRDRLAAYGAEVPERILRIMREDEFESALCTARTAHEDKQRRDAEQAKLDERSKLLVAVNWVGSLDVVRVMSDETFQEFLALATQADQQEKQRQADEADRQRLEREQLEADRKKLETEKEELRQAQQAQADKDAEARSAVDKENDRLAAEAQEKLNGRIRQVMLCHADPTLFDLANMPEAEFVALIERLSQEDAARIQREADAETARREQQRLDDEAAQEKERLRIEALRPDKEKLIGFARQLGALDVPEVGTDARLVRSLVVSNLQTLAENIENLVNDRLK